MNKEVRWNKNMKKTRVQKSRDTVPLKSRIGLNGNTCENRVKDSEKVIRNERIIENGRSVHKI
jgi:hypothetical protein